MQRNAQELLLADRQAQLEDEVASRTAEYKQSEEKFRTFFEQAGLGIFLSDTNSDILDANPYARKLLGYSLDELCTMNARDLVHPDDLRETPLAPTRKRAEQYDSYTLERRYRTKDGRYIPVMVSIRFYGLIDKHIVMFQDISERKQAEEALRRSEAELHRSQRRARLGTWEHNVATGVSHWSDEMFDLFGYEPGEFEPSHPHSVQHILHPDNEDAFDRFRSLLLEQQGSMEIVYKALRKDGSTAWMKTFAEVETNDQGEPVRVLGATQDVTDMKRAEQQLEEAKRHAEAANQAKSEFLANMSHEIRTPLNGMFGMLQLLQRTSLEPTQSHYVDTALDSGRRLLTLLSDILDLSRIEAGKLQISPEPLDLVELLGSVVDPLQPEAQRKGIDLELDAPPNLPRRLVGDPGRLRQVLFNLLGNAIKFTDQGSVTLSVAEQESDQADRTTLVFTIADTGIGIPEEHQERIFDPFHQVEDAYTRRYEGAGLGLGIVRRLVGLMNGKVTMDSEPGSGTTVRFTVSLGLEAAKPRPEAAPRSGQTGPGNPLHVLLVEDDPVNLQAIRGMLESMGHRVTALASGAEVLPTIEADLPDLVIMDIQMPQINGIEATRRIRAADREDIAGLPVVAMTAYAMRGDRNTFLDQGMDDYIAKPLTMEDLAALLQRYQPQAA
jgi:PAS domain S-box-containing protein